MNIPMTLTWVRIALIPVFTMLFFLPKNILELHSVNMIAALIFILAALTDWFDGYLARKLNQVSDFGAFLDPVADKLMVATSLILLVYLSRTSPIAAIIIIGREITISALREWMASTGKRESVAVATIGKLKTAAQMLAIIFLLFAYVPVIGSLIFIGNILMTVACVLTLLSMFHYLKIASKEFK